MQKNKNIKARHTVLITGATGWIGRHVYDVLKENYNLILVDRVVEGCNHVELEYGSADIESLIALPQLPKDRIKKIDLVLEKALFENLVEETKPDCIIHLASVLDNTEKSIIEKNNIINENILDICTRYKVKVIAASSLMTMFGSALANESILAIFNKQKVELAPTEKLGVDTPFNNTFEHIKKLNSDSGDVERNLAYIKSKERLEETAKQIITRDKALTMVMVRFGWTGMRDPKELEQQSNITQIPIRIHPNDLRSFIAKLIEAVLSSKVQGYKVYICVSLHPQSWVKVENTEADFNWKPAYLAGSEYEDKALLNKLLPPK